jgi:hypothetical protein
MFIIPAMKWGLPNQDSQNMHLAAKDGGHAVELSGTILAMPARLPLPCGRRSLFGNPHSISSLLYSLRYLKHNFQTKKYAVEQRITRTEYFLPSKARKIFKDRFYKQ